MKALAQGQVALHFASTEKHPAHALHVLAVATDMRPGELLGLRWEDGDLNTG